MNPLILCIAGRSDTGKTTLILNLLPFFKGDGLKVGVVKNCPHGFDVEDKEGKDSWRFSQAGSDGVLLTSPQGMVIFRSIPEGRVKSWVQEFFYDYDVVLLEGFSGEPGIEKVNVLRRGIYEKVEFPEEELLAVVADFPVGAKVPVFHHRDVEGLYKLILKRLKEEKERNFLLEVNGKEVPVNRFVERIFTGVVREMVESLRREEKEVREISLKLRLMGEAR